jgi:8-oxo-dGTP pyrophosphatase MutT (NUDIX family)
VEPRFQRLRERLRAQPGRPLNLPGLELREAAVLVPLFLREGRPHALFTRRPHTLRTHAGQISFPGGARDPTDPTPLHSALRESHEELGIPPERVEVLGMLDEIPTITQFRVAPFVGVIPGDLVYAPSAEEIAEIIEAPLEVLADPSLQRTERRWVWDQEREIYFFHYEAHVIWGATARILRNLLALWEQAQRS